MKQPIRPPPPIPRTPTARHAPGGPDPRGAPRRSRPWSRAICCPEPLGHHRPDRLLRSWQGNPPKPHQEPRWDGRTKVLGDGSTSYTGPAEGPVEARAAQAGGEAAPVRGLLLGRRAGGRRRALLALPGAGRGVRRPHDVLPHRHLPAAQGQEGALPPAPARQGLGGDQLRHRRAHPRPHWSNSARRGRTATRSAPTSTATSAARRAAATGASRSGRARSTSSTRSSRSGRPTPASRTSTRCRSTSGRRSPAAARPAWRARRTC